MQKTYIDAHWFEVFRSLDIDPYSSLLSVDMSHAEEQRRLFETGSIELPTFYYPRVGEIQFEEKKHVLKQLEKRIVKEESNPHIQEAYVRLIQEKMDQLTLLEAVHRGDDDMLHQSSEKLYGSPRHSVIEEFTPYLRYIVEKGNRSAQPAVISAATALQPIISSLPFDTEKQGMIPFAPQTEKEDVGADALQRMVEIMLQQYGIKHWNISVDTDSGSAFMHVNQLTKTIHIPASRMVTLPHAWALVEHEVGVHVRRSVNAEQGPLQLLTYGLDHYIRADEGLGKYVEYHVYPHAFLSTLEMYVGIALICGVDGVKRNFRDIYNFFEQYYTLQRMGRVENGLSVQDLAWRRAVKLFRGTTGQNAGSCFTKDLVYADGYVDIVKALLGHPAEEKRLFVGKYDPANEFHRALLDDLGIEG